MHRYAQAILPDAESIRLLRSLAMFAALALALLGWVENAEARLKVSSAWLFMPVPLAEVAPVMVAAVDHPSSGLAVHPGGGSLGGLFNRPGLLAGFAAGFLGAGPLGLLFGQGLIAGLAGVPSYLGLFFQLALMTMLVRLIWAWWSGRNAPAFAGLSPRQQAEAYLRSRNELLPGIYPASAADAPCGGDVTTPSNVPAITTAARDQIKA